MSKKTIADFAVDLIYKIGSSTVFTLTGGMAMYINNAVARHKHLKPVYCHHEQACIASAEGFAKASNFTRAGFAVVTAGPGVSNTLTSLISAHIDSAPLIVLAGQIKSKDLNIYRVRTHGIQEIDSKKIITPVVKKFIRISKKNFKKELIETICEAFTGRPGPVFIEIPLDVQALELDYKFKDIENLKKKIKLKIDKLNSNTLVNKIKFNKAIKELLNAKRPLLYIGNGCKIAGVEKEVIKFAKFHQIPCIFSWISSDILSFKDELNFGCPGGLAPIFSNEILSESDFILFLGARLDLATTAFQRKQFGEQAKRIYVDVDKNELRKFKKFSNIKVILYNLRKIKSLLKDFLKIKFNPKLKWLNFIKQKKINYIKEEEKKMDNIKSLNVYQVTKMLSKSSSNKIFVPCSSGYAIETFVRFFKPDLNARLFNGSGLGSMGLGLPHAIGASCLIKNKKIICLEADGGLMLNIQELSTLKYLNPKNFILIILNNNGYESIKISQKRNFGFIGGCDLSSGLKIPDYKKISKAFGLRYFRIFNRNNLVKLNDIILSNRGPTIVEINLDTNEYRGPSVKTIISRDGKIKSTSLNNINW